jgi:hypothetical protein
MRVASGRTSLSRYIGMERMVEISQVISAVFHSRARNVFLIFLFAVFKFLHSLKLTMIKFACSVFILSNVTRATEPNPKRARTTQDHAIADIMAGISEELSLWNLHSLLEEKNRIEGTLSNFPAGEVMISPETLEPMPEDDNSSIWYELINDERPIPRGVHPGWLSVWFHQRANAVGLSPPVEGVGFGSMPSAREIKIALKGNAAPFVHVNMNVAEDITRARLAFEIGIKLISALKQLHTRANIIHGLISTDAISFQDDKILFKSFKRACFTDIAIEGIHPGPRVVVDETNTRYSSTTEMDRMRFGLCPTVQGDIYSAVALVARLASDQDEKSFFGTYETAKAKQWKLSNQFILPLRSSQLARIWIREIWHSIAKSVHEPRPVTYTSLIDKFQTIITILKKFEDRRRLEWSLTDLDKKTEVVKKYVKAVLESDASFSPCAYAAKRTGYETLPKGQRLYLEEILETPRKDTVVYSVRDRPDLMITYYLETGRSDRMRGAVFEMFAYRYGFFRKFMPQISFLSPPGSLTDGTEWSDTQAIFKLSVREFEALRSQETFVRYIVSQRVDKSLFNSVARPRDVIDAITGLVNVVKELDAPKKGWILALKRSEIGLLEGIGGKTIALTRVYRSMNFLGSPRVSEPTIEDIELLSPWRNRNEPYGQRDDLYQILQLLHILMHDPETFNPIFEADLIKISADREKWMDGSLELSMDSLTRSLKGVNSRWNRLRKTLTPIIDQLWRYLGSIPDHKTQVDYNLVTQILLTIKGMY